MYKQHNMVCRHALCAAKQPPSLHAHPTNPSLLKSTASVPGISDHEAVVTDFDTQPQRARSKTQTLLLVLKGKLGKSECRNRKYYRENNENGRGRNQHRHHVEWVQDAATLCHRRKHPLTHSTEEQPLPMDQQRGQTSAQEKEKTI